MEQVCVGVDIGGTSVKLGIFTLSGTLLKKWEIPTEPKNDTKALIEKIGKSIKENLKEGGLSLTDCVGCKYRLERSIPCKNPFRPFGRYACSTRK